MIWLVYRSPYHGVLGKHVRQLPDASVLDCFRRATRAVMLSLAVATVAFAPGRDRH